MPMNPHDPALAALFAQVDAFKKDQPSPQRVRQVLENLTLDLSYFASSYIGGTPTQAQEYACQVLTHAAMYLPAFLQDRKLTALEAATLAHRFAIAELTLEARFTPREVTASMPTDLSTTEWREWYTYAQIVSPTVSRYVACWYVATLIGSAGYYEDGHSSEVLAQMLEELAGESPFPMVQSDLPTTFPGEESRLEFQGIRSLADDRLVLEVQGGEGYEFLVKDARMYPSPDGAEVWISQPDSQLLRLHVPACYLPEILPFLQFEEDQSPPPNILLS